MIRSFTDLHMHSNHSTGSESIAEIIKHAEKLGLRRIVLADYAESKNNLDAIKSEIKSAQTEVSVLTGAEIYADNADSFRKQLKAVRDKVDIVIVHGGAIEINRAAVSDPRVDVLAHPEYRRNDSGLDHVMAKEASDNGVAIELNFREFLHSYRRIRSKILSSMRQNIILANKYGAPVVISSGAENLWDMRPGRELTSLGIVLGMELTEALDAVSTTPEKIVSHVLEVKSREHIMPGLKLKRTEGQDSGSIASDEQESSKED